ncbi:MAG TPA: hypothetical protein VJK03_02985 [Candidatus Nanoarchaeia archaeon]|nr:hypothetical protein [Candidatus Nanoarchaeia archaeon]
MPDYTWEREQGEPVGGLALETAMQLDSLRLRREQKEDKVDFSPLYSFQDKLRMYREKLEGIAINEDKYYQLFSNPLIESVSEWYGLQLEDFPKGTTTHQYASCMVSGLKAIENTLEQIDQSPLYTPIVKINAMRDFCLLLCEKEEAARQIDKLRLAA